jgi:AraC-like DNA-binding protein
MQDFYRKALVAFVLLLMADALLAWCCIELSYPASTLLSRESGAARWRLATYTDAPQGGTSTIRIQNASGQPLSFDFRLTGAAVSPGLSAAWLMEDREGKLTPVDLSGYTTLTFLAKCAPANALIFALSTVDERVSKPGELLTYPPAMTLFSCNEKGVPVSLDLTRLTIPLWWFDKLKVDLSRQSYKLEHVVRFEFGASQYTRRETDSHVEISGLTLHGRDQRYLAALAAVLVATWSAFGIWYFRGQSRALRAKLDARLKKDLPFVAYQHLTLEPCGDQEQAAILRFIATHYTDAELDLGAVAAGTGANRNKINDVLKAELGMTFSSYLNKLRLMEAARLLTDKASATVAEIAHTVGYANGSYFIKLFKEEYGCTPKAFRNLSNQKPSGHRPEGTPKQSPG